MEMCILWLKTYDTNYTGYIGKVIVKNIDTSREYIEIEFQNTIVVGGSEQSRIEQKLRGSIGSLIELRN